MPCAGAGAAREQPGQPHTEVRERRERAERLRHVERENPAVQHQADEEHAGQRQEEHQPLLPPPEPQMSGARNGPRRHAHEHEHAGLGRGPGLLRRRQFRRHGLKNDSASLRASRPGLPQPRSARTNSHPAIAPSGNAASARAAPPGCARPSHSAATVTAVGSAARPSANPAPRCMPPGRAGRLMRRRPPRRPRRHVQPEAARAHRQLDARQVERPVGALMADDTGELVDEGRQQGVAVRQGERRRDDDADPEDGERGQEKRCCAGHG